VWFGLHAEVVLKIRNSFECCSKIPTEVSRQFIRAEVQVWFSTLPITGKEEAT
jgi:hypothetical protein